MTHRKHSLLPSIVISVAVAIQATGQTPPVKPVDPCLGPNPSCSSGCPSSSGDGLNDAWKIVGGIDLNGDGRVDAVHDLILPDVQLGRKDVYVQYDYMFLPDQGTACTPTPASVLNYFGNPNFTADSNNPQTYLKNVSLAPTHAPTHKP